MKFLHYRIAGGTGDLVRVTLTGSAFVRFLDPLNFEYYKNGRPYKSEGGFCDRPTTQFEIPYKGTFHVVVDHNGQEGTAKAVVDIFRRQ